MRWRILLRIDPEGRSDMDKKKLKDVQDATRSQIERFQGYDSAREVVVKFRRDLNSDPARKVHADLKELHLPTLNDVRDESEAKASELGIEA
jgi:hypothetical protein